MLDPTPLKEKALELGFDTVGVCDAVSPPNLDTYKSWLAKGYQGTMDYLAEQLPLKEHPERLLPGVQSVVAVSLNYNQSNPFDDGFPRIARYALGRDYHKVIRGKLRRLSEWLKAEYPGIETRPCVDSAPIMDREFAQLAGLGWYGKNTCLIDSRRGSWFFIGLLLVTKRFAPDAPAVGGCGTCTKCIDACPTGAIKHEDGRYHVDARQCISYLTIEHEGPIPDDLASRLSGWTFGCDVCQEVCPFNQPSENQPLRARITEEPDFLNRREWPALKELAVIQSDAWDDLTRGSAVRRTGLVGLRRNAELCLKACEE
ncbi:MAG: tRNA epoxyqueuosine(34) reductase QueG [Fimbriimonadaceae bacterium]|nr:tRNA epoxyqueuosine(34) reductase QueG [Fimbriimonadaceae bacterium]